MSPSEVPEARGRSKGVLEEEREFFLRSLRDLEAERAVGDIDDGDYLALRDDYTVRAAHVIRELAALADSSEGSVAGLLEPGGLEAGVLEAGPALPEPAPAVPESIRSENVEHPTPWRKRILTGVAVLIIVGGATWAVAAAAGVRLPGESVSGSSSPQQASQLLEAAETAYNTGNPTLAIKDYEAVLHDSPDNVEALTGFGAILVQGGESGADRSLVDQGIAELGKAEILQPSYGPAFGYRGLAYFYERSYRSAIPQLETYLADTPATSRIASIATTLARAKAKLAAGG